MKITGSPGKLYLAFNLTAIFNGEEEQGM